MKLSPAPPTYNHEEAQLMRKALESADMLNFKKAQDIRLQRGERLIMPSPDGTLWIVSVSNAGAMVVTAL